jgi:hypothetical protein
MISNSHEKAWYAQHDGERGEEMVEVCFEVEVDVRWLSCSFAAWRVMKRARGSHADSHLPALAGTSIYSTKK